MRHVVQEYQASVGSAQAGQIPTVDVEEQVLVGQAGQVGQVGQRLMLGRREWLPLLLTLRLLGRRGRPAGVECAAC